MARWLIEIPMLTDTGNRIGIQLFTYDAAYSAARDQALIDVHTPDAIRHRRGARVDITALTIHPFDHAYL